MPDYDGRSENVTILGAGSWGMALAHLIGGNGHQVTIWDRDNDLIESLKNYHVNPRYLQEVILSENVKAVNSLREAVNPRTEWVIVAVSSEGIRDVVSEASEFLAPQTAVLSAAKGLEPDTGFTMSQVIDLLLSETAHAGLVVLSGPNLATEIVKRVPSATVCAGEDLALARRAQEMLVDPEFFRVYTHSDVRGVEIAGAIKNVLAIGAGISDGLGFGDNTKAALMTRGLMEMTQIGIAAGAKPLTFLGLAGVGDLIATATSRYSRNYRVGLGLAERKPIDQVVSELRQAAEGVPTTRAARLLSRRYNVQTPLLDSIYDVIYKGKSPVAAVRELVSRPARDEFS
ncbi:MAG: NAD(P)-dependent glycerol-3-phosphate dehydrogenase [Capsulimonadaceae bacterium]|nr:NAD(P)-dependent glycerol-3-phosphate dehydrogenase [Capsulimonadaceae bacterium]